MATFKMIEQFRLRVKVTQRDIYEGECRLARLCMEKVAVERALNDIDPKGDHKVHVDGGHVRFTLQGYRYSADTPRVPRRALIRFDAEEKAKRKADREGVEFHSKVVPHSYILICVKGPKIEKMSKFTQDRLAQIRVARRKREERTGVKDNNRYQLRKRVEGMAY